MSESSLSFLPLQFFVSLSALAYLGVRQPRQIHHEPNLVIERRNDITSFEGAQGGFEKKLNFFLACFLRATRKGAACQ